MTRAFPSLALLTLALSILPLWSCTDNTLERIPPKPIFRDDKLEIRGSLCTQKPETLVFPLRVLFVVDASVSMEVTDPPDPLTGETRRERAVRETWTRLLDQGPEGVRVGIIRFSAQAQSRTAVDLNGDGLPDTFFTADRVLLDTATKALAFTDRTTNYANALGEAYYEIRNELARADQESLPRSKYVVIFLSDGLPDTDQSESRGNNEGDILDAIRSLQRLATTFRVGDFAFHTAFLAGDSVAAFDLEAQSLLKKMAQVGNGGFRSFASNEALDFVHIDFTVLKRIFSLRALIAVNTNTVSDVTQLPIRPIAVPSEPEEDVVEDDEADVLEDLDWVEVEAEAEGPPTMHPLTFVDLDGSGWAECGEFLVDSDGDGLADVSELALGTDPLVRDTDDDGLNDFIEWQFRSSGLDPLTANVSCFIPNQCVDSDGDGYCDCIVDANSDGICDCVHDPNESCLDDLGHDCLDADDDGWCDCPDLDGDGKCDYPDRDGDGLHDCEELLFGTAQNGVDSDADGLPDPVEVRFNTNPTERDHTGDADFDRILNGMEVATGTYPHCNDASLRSRTAYRYDLIELGLFGTQRCYEFSISNITLVPTLAAAAPGFPGNGNNRILVYAGESSFDDPGVFAAVRVACVMAQYHPVGGYKNPPSGQITLREEHFVDVANFDPKVHCFVP